MFSNAKFQKIVLAFLKFKFFPGLSKSFYQSKPHVAIVVANINMAQCYTGQDDTINYSTLFGINTFQFYRNRKDVVFISLLLIYSFFP